MKQKRMEDEEKKINMILEVIDCLNGMLQKINENKGKKQKTILLIGNTGSGKSTIFNFLSGAKFKFENNKIILIEEKGKNFSKQGDALESITFEPNFNMIDDDHILIDFPGFKDTNGTKNQLSIQLMFNEIVTSTEVKLAVVTEQYLATIPQRGARILELVQNTFTSQNASFQSIGFILNKFGDRKFKQDQDAKNFVKKQLEEICSSQTENKDVYKALSENIIILRKNGLESSIFTDEQRQSLIEQLKSIKPTQYQPDKVDQDNVVSNFIETKLNRLFVEYGLSFIKKKDEAKKKGEIQQFNTTLNQTIQEINQIKQDDLNSVINWMKKNILISCIKDEATEKFLRIFEFFFKYKQGILGFQTFKENILELKGRVENISQEIQAEIQRINEEEERLRRQLAQKEREHRQYLRELREEQAREQRRLQEEKQEKEKQKKIEEERKAQEALKKQQKLDEELREKQAKELAIKQEIENERKKQEDRQKQLKLAEEKKQSEKKNLIKELTSSQNSISKLKADKQKYIKEQEGIYMKAWGGDWSSDYNNKISQFDQKIENEVKKMNKIETDLLKY